MCLVNKNFCSLLGIILIKQLVYIYVMWEILFHVIKYKMQAVEMFTVLFSVDYNKI